jgi:hypothetical protein
MTMSDISVIVYSYKGKLLKDVVDKIVVNSSGQNNLHIKILDQHPLKRNEVFEKNFSCVYTHIFWDWQNSPISYKKTMLEATTEKYTLFIADNIFVEKNWDSVLVDFVKESDKIVSGRHKLQLQKDGHFFLKKSHTIIDNFEITQFIDRGFVFGKTENFLHGKVLPEYLKYNGEEESMSIELFTNGCDIFAAPSSTYTQIGKNNLEELYVPFSLNHNYNSAIDLLQSGNSIFSSVDGRVRSFQDFSLFHNDIFKLLFRLPFQTNDVEYDPMDLNFNSVDARRFVAKTKAIH